MTQKRILVTGATGFVGSHLTRHLLAGGHEVFVTVRPSSDPWRIEPLIDDLTIIPYSLNDPDLNTFIRDIQPEICIHLAWFTEPGKYAASIKNIYSLQASLNLIEQLECNDCQKFIGIGSCFEYDFSLGYFSENSLVKPSSFYSATKIAFSQVVEQWSQYHQMQTLWLRLFYQYGPTEDKRRLVAGIITSLLNNQPIQVTEGEQIRDFLHVEDVAAAIVAVMNSSLNGIVNIGSGQPISVKHIATYLGQLLGRFDLVQLGALPYRKGDPMFVCANPKLLKSQTNWNPSYTIEAGLEQTVKWYAQN